MLGFRQFRQQPFHFVLLQRHVDFDGRVARDRGCDRGPDLLQIQRLLFARELIEQIVQHVLNRGGIHSRWRHLHRHTARAEWLGFESVVLQLVGNLREYCLLRGRQFENDRHQQPLTLHLTNRPLLQNALEQHALVSDMLVDYPQPIFIYRENERVANLSQGFEVAERGKSWVLVVRVERGTATSVGNPLARYRFQSASYGHGRARLDADSAFKMKSRRNRRRRRGLQGKSSTLSLSVRRSPYLRRRH